jgi:hypothetical protein
MQVRRITINDRAFVLVDPESATKMLREIEAAARSGAAWVTIPVRESFPPQVFITPAANCFMEVIEVPDEDPDVDGAAIEFPYDWPSYEL